ncbi:hypothetical protein GCM10028807_27110 [Spirosoma daeguense]
MKTIVYATDFSINARHAAQFACKLALDLNATLVLCHAYHVWPENPAKTGNFPLSQEAVRDQSAKELRKLASELQSKIEGNVSIRCIAREGRVMNVIREVAKTERADLLVMSTVGTAPQSTQLLGSIATGMVAETEVPLLLIPPTVGYAGLKNAVLSINLAEPPNAISLEKTLTFAKALGIVINVACVCEDPNDSRVREKAEQIRRLLIDQPHTLSLITGNELYTTLLAFTRDTKADLLIMLPQTRSWLWKLFSEGETQRMARLTDVPLLAVV